MGASSNLLSSDSVRLETAPAVGSPLMNAAGGGRWPSVRRLLKAGAKVNGVTDRTGRTALMHAAVGPRPVTENFAKGESGFPPGTPEDYLKITEALLEGGADCAATDNGGRTAGHYGAACGNVLVLKFLASKGADLNAVEAKYGRVPLHLAAEHGDAGTVEFLLLEGAKLDSAGLEGCQPLHMAAMSAAPGRGEVIRSLVKHGARVTATENHGGTPLHVAAMQRQSVCKEWMSAISPVHPAP